MLKITAIISMFATVGFVLAVASTIPPCPTEDSTNCYWNASERGNGQGQSFLALTLLGRDILIQTKR